MNWAIKRNIERRWKRIDDKEPKWKHAQKTKICWIFSLFFFCSSSFGILCASRRRKRVTNFRETFFFSVRSMFCYFEFAGRDTWIIRFGKCFQPVHRHVIQRHVAKWKPAKKKYNEKRRIDEKNLHFSRTIFRVFFFRFFFKRKICVFRLSPKKLAILLDKKINEKREKMKNFIHSFCHSFVGSTHALIFRHDDRPMQNENCDYIFVQEKWNIFNDFVGAWKKIARMRFLL